MEELAEKLTEMHEDVCTMKVFTESQQTQVDNIQKEIEDLLIKIQHKANLSNQ